MSDFGFSCKLGRQPAFQTLSPVNFTFAVLLQRLTGFLCSIEGLFGNVTGCIPCILCQFLRLCHGIGCGASDQFTRSLDTSGKQVLRSDFLIQSTAQPAGLRPFIAAVRRRFTIKFLPNSGHNASITTSVYL